MAANGISGASRSAAGWQGTPYRELPTRYVLAYNEVIDMGLAKKKASHKSGGIGALEVRYGHLARLGMSAGVDTKVQPEASRA